jgi:hypothetical protein
MKEGLTMKQVASEWKREKHKSKKTCKSTKSSSSRRSHSKPSVIDDFDKYIRKMSDRTSSKASTGGSAPSDRTSSKASTGGSAASDRTSSKASSTAGSAPSDRASSKASTAGSAPSDRASSKASTGGSAASSVDQAKLDSLRKKLAAAERKAAESSSDAERKTAQRYVNRIQQAIASCSSGSSCKIQSADSWRSSDTLPYSEDLQEFPPGEDPGNAVPVSTDTAVSVSGDQQGMMAKHDALYKHKLDEQKQVKKEFVELVTKDLANCLDAATNSVWTDRKCGEKLEDVVQSIAKYNDEILNEFKSDDQKELTISVDELTKPYMAKNQELLDKVDPNNTVVGKLPIYIAGKPQSSSPVVDLTSLLTKGLKMDVSFPYQLLATEAQLKQFISGVTAQKIVQLAFGKMRIKDCDDIPAEYQSAKEQCNQIKANAQKLIDAVRDNKIKQIGPVLPPNDAPMYTPIDVSSPKTILPSAGKFLQLPSEEQNEAALAIQRIQRGRAIRRRLANATESVEGIKMLLPPVPVSQQSGLSDADERSLLGGPTFEELENEGHAKDLVSGKKNAVELANDLHKQITDREEEDDLHDQMLKEAMDENDDFHEQMLEEAMDEKMHEQMAQEAMDEKMHEQPATMDSLLAAFGTPEEQEKMRRAWAKADTHDAATKAATKASIAAGVGVQPVTTEWVFDPRSGAVTKLDKSSIDHWDVTGAPVVKPELQHLLEHGKIYSTEAEAIQAAVEHGNRSV